MNLLDLLKATACRGITIEVAGGGERLKVTAPKGTMTTDIHQALGQYKWALLTWLHHRPAGACACCKGIWFWLSVHHALICAACHPPADPSLVAEWIEIP